MSKRAATVTKATLIDSQCKHLVLHPKNDVFKKIFWWMDCPYLRKTTGVHFDVRDAGEGCSVAQICKHYRKR